MMMDSGYEQLKFEDVKDISLRKSDLVKWLDEPFFEDLTKGCFVRYASGASSSGAIVYKLYWVANVDATKKDRVYKVDGFTTNKYLNIILGKEFTIRLSINHVSDSPPLLHEFEEWLLLARSKDVCSPTMLDVLVKKEAIGNINNYIYSATTKSPSCVKNQAQVITDSINNTDSVYSLMKDLLLTISEQSSESHLISVVSVSGEENLQQALVSLFYLAKKNLTEIIEDDNNITEIRKLLRTIEPWASTSLNAKQSLSVKFLRLHFDRMIDQYMEFKDFPEEFDNFQSNLSSSLEDLRSKQREEDQRQAKLREIARRENELEGELARLKDSRNAIIEDRIESADSIGLSVQKVKELLEIKPQMEIKMNNSQNVLLSLTKQWDSMMTPFVLS